jgi:putative intracellular protease/amidase
MRTIGAVIFPGFELLDLYGPLELLGSDHLREHLTTRIVGPLENSASAQGPRTVADDLTTDDPSYDILLIPGGEGTRDAVNDEAFMAWLKRAIEKAEVVAVVCTGAFVFGLLSCWD